MKYTQLIRAIDSASQQLQARAVKAVNQFLVLCNWLIGAYIVEFEQHGEDRAKYGAKLLQRLAKDLEKRRISGLGLSTLKSARQFYFCYPQMSQTVSELLGRSPIGAEKGQPLVGQSASCPVETQRLCVTETVDLLPSTITAPAARKSGAPPITPLSARSLLQLSWTHLLEFFRIDDPLKRAFYENECLKGNWSKRQLRRQIGSLLYERTALSKNKQTVIRRAQRQERQETIEDLIRDPYVLEFTGLAERFAPSSTAMPVK